MAPDCMNAIVVAHTLISRNPHQEYLTNRKPIIWSTHRFMEAGELGAHVMGALIVYDKEFGKFPDNLNTLRTWYEGSVDKDTTIAREMTQFQEDIDSVKSRLSKFGHGFKWRFFSSTS
jgi:hypothetical protein